MILVLSHKHAEASTNDIVDWLDSVQHPYLRLNGEDLRGGGKVSLTINDGGTSFVITIDGIEYTDSQFNVVMFRRWFSGDQLIDEQEHEDLQYARALNHLVTTEFWGFTRTFFNILSDKVWVSNPAIFDRALNKNVVLPMAAKMGLSIPSSILTTSKDHLLEFKRKFTGVVTKTIAADPSFTFKGEPYSVYTTFVDDAFVETLPCTFPPTLFQEGLDKEYELRIFIFDGVCYPMAIFSQSDQQTKADFRVYNLDHPNRTVPYVLPQEVEENLLKLMDSLELITGSVDIVKTMDGRYVFLEVNPTGQFGMVSFPCNYPVERTIAQYLIEKDNERN